MTKSEYPLRSANETDAPKVSAIVDAAYGDYVERFGMLPRPMTDDYAEVIRSRQVTVAESRQAIVGMIVLAFDEEGFLGLYRLRITLTVVLNTLGSRAICCWERPASESCTTLGASGSEGR